MSVRNSGPAIIGGVDFTDNGDHGATHLRRGRLYKRIHTGRNGKIVKNCLNYACTGGVIIDFTDANWTRKLKTSKDTITITSRI